MSHETFWANDPAHLFTPETWARFVPTDWMTVPEALNAVVRFTVYFSTILTFVSGRSEYILASPIVGALTFLLYKMYPETQSFKEGFTDGKVRPTPSNPFMNPTLVDINENPGRPAAPSVASPAVAESIANAFSKTSDLFMDTSDRFDMAQASRAFYTVPQGATNDLSGYQEFLNKDNVSRKLDSESYVSAKGSVHES